MTQPQAGAVTGAHVPTHTPTQAPTKDTPADVRRRLRSIFSGSVGNLVEWYDWYVYSAFALYFAKSFFPKGDQTAQLLNTAAVFAVGFLARPVGGWLMGIYADRYGRKRALFFSVVLMCMGSLIIALTPSYATIGVAAPVLLVLARLLQGLSVGGEYGTSATYLSEVANKENRGFFSSFQYVTLIAGQLVALALLIVLQQFVLTHEQLEAWGWRIPFFIGALCALIAMRMRSHMEETQSFTAAKDNKKRGTLAELAKHPRAVATVVGLTLGGTVAFYTYSIYMQKFLANTVGLSKDQATLVSGATLLLFAILQPIVGGLSDRIGRRPILIAFGVLGTLFTVPIMTGISQTTSVWTAFFLIMAALVIVSGYTSINAVVKAELFPAEVRALGVGLPYALTVSIFGGTAEYIALWLKQAGHESLFYWYVTGTIFISLMVYVFMRDTRKHSRIEH
ncbi:MFS transporter [Ralstonia insidiosa]|jgi:MHS family alpha-ketoglutarate permease-like MFS transporter|uniref:MFS transporter n=1 Tax=Ralstonia TaxID=48736 RepID=UPI000664A7BB|nr:MFS transporter [Ralstonia insidiosa]KMW45533.1 alpha-ketoglutarate transporter [Ralstonia sp. MD27]MBX3772357.1 MFS transporter [Ralstonia pickettii]NOZ16526.1 MFS transporter [Betaproteobacteria bacterium]MBA9857013.1 MFS transporter [Ralstonia insidiosa]MBA9870113.1 MFS transporter [Ralstonia insidiosa]